MNWTTEKDIRLFILSRLERDYKEIAALYLKLEEMPSNRGKPVRLDVADLAA